MKNIQNQINKPLPASPYQGRSKNFPLTRGIKGVCATNLSGFTLVELIVVITILAILGVIAFTQMGGFQGNARDSDRVTTLSQLDSGLELYKIKIGTYPTPEVNSSGVVLTGSIDGIVYANLGTIGDVISRNLKMSKTPLDPASSDRYVYATNSTQAYYQIAATLENSVAYNIPHPNPLHQWRGNSFFSLLHEWRRVGDEVLIPQAQAATPAQARVNGNYPGYIKFLSGSTNPTTYIANIPSLIWYATGASVNLMNTTTYFIANKQNNLPYKFNSTDTIQNQNATQILQSITGYSTATLTLTGITSLTATGIEAQFGTQATLSPALASFGGDIAKLKTAILGTSATTGSTPIPNSCATNPSFANLGTLTTGTPTSVGQAWTYNTTPGNCTYTCINGYTGNNCATPPAYVAANSTATYTAGMQFTYGGVTVTVTSAGIGTGSTTYAGCDTPDIVIWASTYNPQIWAACNVGATTSAGFATVPAQSPNPSVDAATLPANRVANVQGNYYQWGRNDNVTSGTWTTSQWGGALTSPANTTGNTNFYQGEATYGDWHWAGATNPAGGWNVANGGDNQGPCATGYHIPTTDATITTTDWKTAAFLVVGTASPTTTQFDTIRSTLKLPLAGLRSWTNGQYYDQGTNGYYWSSSPTTTYSYYAYFTAGGGNIANTNSRGYGFSLRCLKN